ncbi:DUF1552 domain-containing protein [Urbifossiella limnaea]|uniref:DUF1552 domain-containing protein n=1 Tax=Urbifossiella limnaea TaxID=2528023 RepID=A0A517XSW5_9BACT|nr:DUF1552 domain-containing protein [Urbifossiella limnaea]QDU20630.1 hypothetical protein ETAA1_25860 [Urbifossiella limnaea]
MVHSRRDFLRDLGVGAAALPFVGNLPGLGFANQTRRKQRLVVMFSPNGVIPGAFWPKEEGADFTLPESLTPLAPFKDKTLILNGVCDRVRGDGDAHMRGIGCLLTGVELFPGNIQGGSHTPAGWASGNSIDQEIRTFLQRDAATRTRFGSLEFGVMVPDRADTWTRMVYTAANKPVAPIDDPYQMFNKLYGRTKDRELLGSVLDDVSADLNRVAGAVGAADRRLLDEHATFVREMEQELRAARAAAGHEVPRLEPGVRKDNDRIPQISRMQIDLMVNAFKADFSRVATLQYTNSVGMARMRWLDITEGHHELSHEPDTNQAAVDKLTRINKWFAGELAYLARKLADTPEPGGTGTMLDNTVIVWTNELGKGNSHTLDNIPFLLVGGGLDFKTGRSLKFPRVAHNRLLMSLAHGFGHRVERFGSGEFCGAGALNLS